MTTEVHLSPTPKTPGWCAYYSMPTQIVETPMLLLTLNDAGRCYLPTYTSCFRLLFPTFPQGCQWVFVFVLPFESLVVCSRWFVMSVPPPPPPPTHLEGAKTKTSLPIDWQQEPGDSSPKYKYKYTNTKNTHMCDYKSTHRNKQMKTLGGHI